MRPDQVERVRRSLPHVWQSFFARFGGNPLAIQRRAIPPLLEGGDCLICAPTATGKTEAVTAPLAERILTERWEGLAVVYVSPTRALVNDLYRRLLTPLAELGAPKLLVFVNRRQDAEQLAGELARQLPFEGQVHAHHGSLSRALRESVDLPGLARISEAGLVGPGGRGLPDGLPYP